MSYLITAIIMSMGYLLLLQVILYYRTHGNILYAWLFLAIMFFLSGITSSFGRTSNHLKEVSIRKMLGASIKSIFLFMLVEALLISLVAVVLSLVINDFRIFRHLYSSPLTEDPSSIEFILIGASAVLQSLLSGIWHTYKWWTANPVTHLRTN